MQHVLPRLHDIGVIDVCGVPDDYSEEVRAFVEGADYVLNVGAPPFMSTPSYIRIKAARSRHRC
jgi:TPP-dependent 2-oxoacid decarboxylase